MSSDLAALRLALRDRYTIERELGRGGMAVVYAAVDVRHVRPVAVKALNADVAGAIGAERFLREVRIAAGLSHPHLVPVLDSGEADGVLYYVMPLVAGETLRARLDRDGALPASTAFTIAAEVADALDYAHKRGVWHRDVKPENILLVDGHAMVTDFGIARAVAEAGADRLTSTGVALGTPAYMSPEQASGERVADARSDLFSLGTVLYEMLAGESPFAAPTMRATLTRVVAADVTPLRHRRPELAGDADALASALLAKDPDQRPAGAGAVAAQLRAMAADALRAPARRPFVGRRAPARRVALGLGLVAALAVAVWIARGTARTPRAGAFDDATRVLAVLPFVNDGGDSTDAYFSDGIAEELLTALAQVPGLTVKARSASFGYRGRSVDVRQVGRELGVGSVLEANVRRAGDSLRLTAHFVDTRTGDQLWSASFTRRRGDEFALQEEIARAIVTALRLRLDRGDATPIVRGRTENVEAHDLVLRAAFEMGTGRRASEVRAAALVERAIALDSNYAAAWAHRAEVYQALAIFREGQADALLQARRSAERAASLDSTSAEVQSALGILLFRYDWKWADAERHLRRAISINPDLPDSHANLARFLRSMGRFDEAEREHEVVRALGGRGGLPELYNGVSHGRVAYFARDYARAIHETRDRGDSTARTWITWLAQALIEHGDYAAAESLLVRKDDRGEPGRDPTRAYLYARSGRAARARALLDSLDRAGTGLLHYRAGAWAVLGDRDRAMAAIDEAIRAKDVGVVDFKVSPFLDPLRADPRFQRVMQRLAFP